MTYFVVKFLHTDLENWEKHLTPHLIYLKDQIKEGNLLMSGPIENVGDDRVEALLVFSVENKDVLHGILEGDPFWIEGLVADYEIIEWNPMFGLLGASAEEMEEYFKKQA